MYDSYSLRRAARARAEAQADPFKLNLRAPLPSELVERDVITHLSPAEIKAAVVVASPPPATGSEWDVPDYTPAPADDEDDWSLVDKELESFGDVTTW